MKPSASADGVFTQARQLADAGHPGAARVRAAAGIEVAVRFFLARPLLQGAFLSDEWAQLLAKRLLNGRTAEDRELLPAILRNWKVDVTKVKLRSGQQAWEQLVGRVWQRRNDYVHKAADVSANDAQCAIECRVSRPSTMRVKQRSRPSGRSPGTA